MTQLEDMLRTAFSEKAGRIPDHLPPPDLDSAHSSRSARRSRSRATAHRAWLIPVAAAVAVLAVAASTIVTSGALGTRSAGGSATSAISSVPRYYVALRSQRISAIAAKVTAIVAATRTGTVLASVTAPRPDVSFTNVSGAADDRTFVLAAAQQNPPLFPPERLYLLRIRPGAHRPADVARLVPLAARLPRHSEITAMAVSPNGQSLAVIASAQADPRNRLIIYNLTTGASRTWTIPGCSGLFGCMGTPFFGVPGNTSTISWTADGRLVALSVSDPRLAVRLLDVDAPGSNLLAASRRIPLHGAIAMPGQPGKTRLERNWSAVQISPDGRSVFLGVWYQTDYDSLMRFSARTGALTSVLNYLSAVQHGVEELLWTSRDGDTLIVTGIRRGTTAGIVSGGHYTVIPWSAAIEDAAW